MTDRFSSFDGEDIAKGRSRFRLLFSFCFFLILSLLLAARYFDLQVFQYAKFATQAEKNRIHKLPIAPRRGLIYDRHGVVLADNKPSYSLMVTRERVEDMSSLLLDLQQIFDIDENTIKKFEKRLSRRAPYQPTPLKVKLTEDEISRYAVNRYRLTGVDVEASLVRNYPFGESMAHVLGYVGRINVKEQENIDKEEFQRARYAATDYIGKIGIEKYYEDWLHGDVGSRYVETNVTGRVLRTLTQVDAQPGNDLYLTIDAAMQNYITESLVDKRASVVVVDVYSGEILSMVSTPSYDANLFVTGISTKDYAKLRDDIDLPLFNRSLQGQYPPGSTVKPIFGLAGLHYGVVSEHTTVADPGWYQLPGDDRLYRDWKKGGHHERINLRQSIAESCDVFFYDLAFKLGIDRIAEFSNPFGLGQKTHVDTTHEKSGILPSSRWKKEHKGVPWFPGETLNVGIGQGYMLATPLQLAALTTVLANKGVSPRLHLNKHRFNSGDDFDIDLTDLESTNSSAVDLTEVSANYWRLVHQSMVDVVHSNKGTARSIGANLGFQIAGKTGTAQVIGIAQDEEYDAEAIAERQRDHALFIGYAPANKPEIAVAVIVENGGSGSGTAAPIARKVFDWYIEDKKQRQRPQRGGDFRFAQALESELQKLKLKKLSINKQEANDA